MKMSRPWRIFIMGRTARLAQRYAPARFVSITEAKASSLISARSWSLVMPALATSTSTGPCAASAAVNASATLSVFVTSQRTTVSPSTGSPDREVAITLSPPAASRRAMASPMPRFPPVTSTDRPKTRLLLLTPTYPNDQVSLSPPAPPLLKPPPPAPAPPPPPPAPPPPLHTPPPPPPPPPPPHVPPLPATSSRRQLPTPPAPHPATPHPPACQ